MTRHLHFRVTVNASLLVFWIAYAEAHQGHHHPAQGQGVSQAGSKPEVQIIRKNYLQQIKPIFKEKCMDCHSNQTRYPWYHSVPGVRQVIDQDIVDARKHLDFSNDFPFISHATMIEDLEAIRHSISEGSMPPFSYRVLHSGSQLSDLEKKKVADWVEESLKLLNKAK